MTNIVLPDARVSNLTISPNSDKCLFIKNKDGEYKPLLVKEGDVWKINKEFTVTS